ncbi:SAM-dependent methyltransferase [Streptomyces sp. MP131-18]|uniref:SAM-dependent methyltransferase n=1 Tax=Streptomyces sp. MP131-18 TaxID=1857892 RepID=UPI00097CA49A|nr:SAM-dependent methyltransferase [Streptomyces sp. MP131-18]
MPLDLRLDIPHSARMYDFYLGGKDNYAPDREAARQVEAVFPGISVCARENRHFMHRVTRMLVAQHGMRQWLDIGTGIPTSPNLHEVAQDVEPQVRVVYVDNDPIVLAHARALLNSSPEGRTAYIQADVRHPERILAAPQLTATLDLCQPIVLSLHAVLHFVPDESDPYGIVRRLLDALPSGSALALSHCTPDFDPETWARVVDIYRAGGTPAQVRSRSEVERFFEGLDLAEPGLEVAHRWRPDPEEVPRRHFPGPEVNDATVSLWAGVGFKP